MDNSLTDKTLIQSEQVKQLFSGFPITVVSGISLAAILAYSMWGSVDPFLVTVWLALIAVVSLARVLLRAVYQRAAPVQNPAVWLNRFRLGALSISLVWGSAGVLFFSNDVTHQMILFFVLAGAVAGGTIAYAVDMGCAIPFVLAILLPVVFRLFSTGGEFSTTMGMTVMVFMVFMVVSLRRIYLGMKENIVMQIQAVKRADALYESEAKLHAAYDATSDALILFEKQRIFDCNQASVKMFGCASREQFCATPLADFSPPTQPDGTDSLVLIRQQMAVAIQQGHHRFEWLCKRLNTDELFPAEALFNTMELHGKKVMQATVRDITERKKAEARLQRLISLYATLSQCNQAIVNCSSETELFQQVCHDAVQLGGLKMAWIGLVDQASQQVKPVAYYGMGTEYLDDIRISVNADDPTGQGTTGTAIRENRPVWVQDFQNDPRLSPWHQRGVNYQWGSVAALPLHRHGAAVGAIMLYAGIVDAFDEAERHLLMSLATDISHALTRFALLDERGKSEEEIHQLAFYDPLTQLPNRRLLLDRLRQAMVTSSRNGTHCALLFLDLDHFKIINDTQGHDMGDLLLIEVAGRLQACVRQGDSVARLGGDEFIVVLEGLSSEAGEAAMQTESVAEKIRHELGQSYQLKNYECLTTPSMGICLLQGDQESVENLLKYADVAMYQAKAAGRNAIRFFDPAMQAILDKRASMEKDLRRAMEQQQFRLFYQIQVDNLRRPQGAEVLLRWEHPERGLVSPLDFIPLAEETGLILPIGLWVLITACVQLRMWQDYPLTRDLTLAVNVSAKQFRQPNFVAQVQRALWETGAKASRLKLELTESVVLENVEDTINKMRELKLLGVSFSMDDFGTGYSSLQYLKQLPLDQIKIDQSFVRDIASDPNDAAIVQTIVAMTEKLGFNVIAEGVETQAQLEFLEQCGCRAYQGYLFSKPVPLEDFETLLRKY